MQSINQTECFEESETSEPLPPMRPEPNRIKTVQSDCLFFKVEQGIMESTLAVMIVLFVAKCGAVPVTSPSQEEISKAQVKKKRKKKVCLVLQFVIVGVVLPDVAVY